MVSLLATTQILLDQEQERPNADQMRQTRDARKIWKKIQMGLLAPQRTRRRARVVRRPNARSRQAPAQPEAMANLSYNMSLRVSRESCNACYVENNLYLVL